LCELSLFNGRGFVTPAAAVDHLFVGENYYGFDDAGLVSLKVLELLSKTDQTVSELLSTMPVYVPTPEIIMSAPDDLKFEIVNTFKQKLSAKYPVNDIDGARVAFPNGWGLVRASNTQPALTMRFEADTRERVVTYMQEFGDLLSAYPQVDASKINEQIEAFSK